MSFWRPKGPKSPAHGKIVTSALCSCRMSEHSVGHLLATHGFRLFCRVLRTLSNIPRTMACKQAAMSWIFNGAGFSGITYAMNAPTKPSPITLLQKRKHPVFTYFKLCHTTLFAPKN